MSRATGLLRASSASARRFYNGSVRELNTAVESFPLSLVARWGGFSPRSYFETDASHRSLPTVGFSGS
ncbi:MAG: hypothetical protein EON93_26415 [Burkholderiales bacterium]|nr:MAG: hypothetical protein EON93_26415 [Burkholderiales bacterium]